MEVGTTDENHLSCDVLDFLRRVGMNEFTHWCVKISIDILVQKEENVLMWTGKVCK